MIRQRPRPTARLGTSVTGERASAKAPPKSSRRALHDRRARVAASEEATEAHVPARERRRDHAHDDAAEHAWLELQLVGELDAAGDVGQGAAMNPSPLEQRARRLVEPHAGTDVEQPELVHVEGDDAP